MMQLLHMPFVKNIATFINDISPAAAINSLTQVILRCMVPGVPDLYQGREGWDFSLVDPDNRRPVNYLKLQENLEQEVDLLTLARSWRDGKIKQAIIYKLLGSRKKYPQIFTNGRYEGILVEGPLSDHVVAFQRFTKDVKIIVIVTRFNFSLNVNEYLQSYHDGWNKTKVFLHDDLEMLNGKAFYGEMLLKIIVFLTSDIFMDRYHSIFLSRIMLHNLYVK